MRPSSNVTERPRALRTSRYRFTRSMLLILGSLLACYLAASAIGEPSPCDRTLTPDDRLQPAIDAAPVDGVLCLSSGIWWQENVVIDRDLTLRGDGRSLIIGEASKAPVMAVAAGRVALVDLQVSGLPAGCTFPPGCARHGIRIEGEAEVRARRVRVEGNPFEGIQVRDRATLALADSWIEDNGLQGGNGGVIFLDDSSGTIRRTTFRGQADDGLQTRGRASVVVEDAAFLANRSDGIEVRDRSHVEVTGSRFADNRLGSIRLLGNATGQFSANSYDDPRQFIAGD